MSDGHDCSWCHRGSVRCWLRHLFTLRNCCDFCKNAGAGIAHGVKW